MRSPFRRLSAGAYPLLLLVTLLACRGDNALSPARDVNPVLLIGVDGATWDVIDPMIERGELPNIKALVERGVSGRLISVEPLSSPVVWTTIATGRFPREHGILDFTFPYEEGTEKLVVRSSVRKVPAIWNVASHAGLRVNVIGYFVTHPPETINGTMISDRAYQGVAGSIIPAEVEARVRLLLETLKERREQRPLQDRFIHWEYDRKALEDPDDPYHEATQVVAGRIDRRIVHDEFFRRAVVEVMTPELDLTMAYFRITDHASHVGWWYYDSSDFESEPGELEAELLHDLIPESYRFIDEVIGDLVARAGENTNVVIVSDHGFGSATGYASIERKKHDNLTGNHRVDGILLAAGPNITRGRHDRMTIVDVAPTLLAMLGLPISRELAGRVEEELFADRFLERHPPRYERAYEFDWSSPEAAEDLSGEEEEEALKELQALGYIGSTTASGVATRKSLDFWGIEPRLRHRALLGELTYLLYRDDQRRARALLREIVANEPSYLSGLRRTVQRQIERIEGRLQASLFEHVDLDAIFAEAAEQPVPAS